MSSLPVIVGNSAAIYPFTVDVVFRTMVGRFQNGAEQRSVAQPGGLLRFQIPYPALTQAQKNTVLSAVTAAKGQFGTNLTLTLGSTTYTGLSLDSDDFAATENFTLQYDAPLKVSQTITQNLSPGTAGQPFPTLANGAMGILPYTQRKMFQTIAQKVAAGLKYTTAEFAGGLTGYPVDGLFGWTLDERRLTDADLSTRMGHFIANWGRAFSFQFTDETRSATNGAMRTGSSAVPFAADPGMPVGQVIQIDSEQMQVTGAYSGGGVPVTRAFNGTTAASHLSGAPAAWVYLNAHYSADMLTFRYNSPNNSDVKIGIEATN
jgi:hypothetical protein